MLCVRTIPGFEVRDSRRSWKLRALGLVLGRQWAESWREDLPLLYVPMDPKLLWDDHASTYSARLAHAYVHFTEKQRDGWRWDWHYVTSRAFRLAAEVRAFVAEILFAAPGTVASITVDRFTAEASAALASRTYLWAARSAAEAQAAFAAALVELPLLRSVEPYATLLAAGA